MTSFTALLALGLAVLMQQSEAYPFNTVDFPSVFEKFEVDDAVSASDVNANLMALEKRFNESLFAKTSNTDGSSSGDSIENRMTELQEQFEGVQSLKHDGKQTKDQVEKMQNRLETMEKKVTSASTFEAILDDLDAKVSTGSKKTKKDIDDLKTAQDKTDEKLATIDVKVTDVKDKIKKTEKKVTLIKEDVDQLKHRLGAQGTQSVQSSLGSPNGGRPEQPGIRPGADSQGSERPGSAQPGSEKPGTAGDASICPSDYYHDASAVICVKLVRSPLPSSSAEQKCAQMADGGSLAVLDTSDKVRAVKDYLRREGQRTDVFVGGKKEPGTIRNYRWVWNDKPVDPQAAWCPGQPEDRGCISLWAGMGFCLDDSWCGNANPFLCQVDISDEKKKKEAEEAGYHEFD